MVGNPFMATFHKNRVHDKFLRYRSARRRAFVLCPELLEDRTVLSSLR
jgi:hypothetical protein